MTCTCVECGNEFIQNTGRGPKRKYCSDNCKKNHYQKVYLSNHGEYVCQHCGVEFSSKYAQKYCSMRCYRIASRTIKGSIRVCVVCGSEFEPTNKTQKCCSKKCQVKQAGLTNSKTFITKKCAKCGEDYKVTKNTAHGSAYCADCRHDGAGRGWDRRAIVMGLPHEKIKRKDLFERDGYVCQICHGKVDKTKKWPHPDSPSLDHIVPISRGGGHVWSNVQCTHWSCNASKKTKRTGSQMRLELGVA